MAKRRRKRESNHGGAGSERSSRGGGAPVKRDTGETRAADAATIAWTVAVMSVLVCDLAAALGYFLTSRQPGERRVFNLAELTTAAGAVIGLVTLGLTPLVYRIRRVPPPTGLIAFAICASLAPFLALTLRAMR